MKIIHMVCDPLNPGGYQYAIHQYCNGLVNLGHEVVLLARNPSNHAGPSICDQEEIKYKVVRYFLPPLKGILHGFFGARAIKRLQATFQADIIHCTMGWPCPLWCLDALTPVHPGLIAMFQGSDVQTNPEMNYGIRLNPRVDAQVKRIIHECPNLMTVSQCMVEEITALGGSNISVIPVGVDFDFFQKKAERPQEKPYIFAMARLVPKKGIDLLLQAYAEAVRGTTKGSFPDLCIAGVGPEQNALMALAAELGIGEQVQFLGFIQAEEKRGWFLHAEFFVHPSRREPLGIVNLEALASGLPVICFGVDGHLDIFKSDAYGFLIQPYEVQQMAEKMLLLVNNTELRNQMAVQAPSRAKEYDWPVLAGDLLRVYERILAE